MGEDWKLVVVLGLAFTLIFFLGFIGGRHSKSFDSDSWQNLSVECLSSFNGCHVALSDCNSKYVQCSVDLFSEHQAKLQYIDFINNNCSSSGG